MTTIASLPFAKVPKGYSKNLKEKSSTKPSKQPARSMTHPLHEPPKGPKIRRVKAGEPFDAEELTRRLTAHLAEQKAASQRRREARASEERARTAAIDATYHHVPTVAAAAFQRTATPSLVTEATVHKLAAPVLKAALTSHAPDQMFEGVPRRSLNGARPKMGLQKTVARDQLEVEKEKVRNRNQFQRTRDIAEAAEVDELRDVYRMPQRTFGEFAHLRTARPLSTGDVFEDDDDTDSHTVPRRSKSKAKPRGPPVGYDGRNDWAQEEVEKEKKSPGRTVKERVSGPFMKKKESVWVLMGRKEKAVLGGKEEEAGSPPPLDGKRSFLARFKRQPSC